MPKYFTRRKPTATPTAWVYCGVSSKIQAKKDKVSLPVQEREGRDLAAQKGWLVTKVITVDVGADYAVDKINVTSTDKSIETEVVPVPDKKEFRVIVKPTESGRPINASLKIEPVLEADAHKPYYANVRIDSRAKPPPQ